MKKLINLLKNSLFVTCICSLFSVGILTNEHKEHKVDSVSAVSTSISDMSLYTPFDVFDSSFYFDWTYLTYSTENNQNRSITRSIPGQIESKPSNLYNGLMWIGNEPLSFGGTGYTMTNYYTGFYSYYNTYASNYSFARFDTFHFGTGTISYGVDGTYYDVTINNIGTPQWKNDACSVIVFLGTGVTGGTESVFIDWLYSHGDFFNVSSFANYTEEILSLQSTIGSLSYDVSQLQGQITSLEGQVSDLQDEITLLESQISDLEDEITSLESQLNNAILSTRQSTYIVDIKSILNYEFEIFVNVDYRTDQDFYIKPRKITCNSSIEVVNASGVGEESYFNVIDILDLSELDVDYYYSYADLYDSLYIEVNDSWLLDIPYYLNDEITYFSLDSINAYIDDWLFSYKFDISVSTSYEYFRSAMVEYNNLITSALGGTNMSYLDGYYSGFDEGYLSGKDDGYNLGFGEGYQDGFTSDSTVSTIFSGILQVSLVPINFFLAIFNFEILGINLSGFIRALFTVALTIIVIKIVLGNKGGD